MPTHNDSFKTCGSLEALNSTTFLKKCGVKTSAGRHECYILKTHLELPYRNYNLPQYSFG